MKAAVIILFHGSRAEEAGEAVDRIVAEVRRRGAFDVVIGAFLQHAAPGLAEAADRCAEQGASSITVVPFFLQMGKHATADVPRQVEEMRKRHPGLPITVTKAVGVHPLMAEVVLDLARADRTENDKHR